ncbi:MAG: tRNA (N(6)-L-threonylcarbamoyladenosine(37)-C(2))-methylthiotransferase MtaB, partial [Rhizomicrobium sp.]
RFRAMIGRTYSVLVEKSDFGHSECFAPVQFEPGAAVPGEIMPVVITGIDEGRLVARRTGQAAA